MKEFIFVGKLRPQHRIKPILFSLNVLWMALRGYYLSIETKDIPGINASCLENIQES